MYAEESKEKAWKHRLNQHMNRLPKVTSTRDWIMLWAENLRDSHERKEE